MTTNKSKLSTWTLIKVWYIGTCVPCMTTYPRFYGTGFATSLIPAIKALYPNNKEEMIDALKTYGTQYHLAEPNTGTGMHAIVLRMEEERANGADISRETAVNFKLGVMGGMTGFGDTIYTSTLRPLAMAVFTPMAIEGNFMGPIGFMLFKGFARIIGGVILFTSCWAAGKSALASFMKQGSGLMAKATAFVTILSMMVMGAMTSKYVTLQVALKTTNGETVTSLQSFLNGALPGIIPLAAVLGSYALMKKDWSALKIIGLYAVICILGAVVGLF